jgi:hypothetical protein
MSDTAVAMDLLGDILKIGFQLLFMALFLGGMGLLFLVPLVLIGYTFIDIFNRDDIGLGKLLWSLIVLLVPFAGLAIYWLARPAGEQAPASTLSMNRGTPVTGAEAPAAERRAA